MLTRLAPLGGRGDGVQIDSVQYFHYSGAGELLHRLARRVRGIQVLEAIDQGGLVIVPPFTPTSTVVVQPNSCLFGGGSTYEIKRCTPDGRLTHLYRRVAPSRRR